VGYSILDERLKEQWRYERSAIGRNVDANPQAVAESHLLDLEEPFRQLQLPCKRDTRFCAEGETVAKKSTEQHAHAPGSRWVRRRQGADRVQTVEQEVWIDLGAKRPKFRLASVDLGLESAPLRLP
jgi:hypothetical protein